MDIGDTSDSAGRRFAAALAAKDFGLIAGLLDPEVDFRGMTPGRSWEASGPGEVDAVLQQWFEPSDQIDELVEIEEGGVADRGRVGYRFRGHNDDGGFVVEQQAYFTERDGRIDWMRVLCSGFRPL
ncbi:MAG: nuclear transport factor 2 family protein [Solirubrobacterales bacterium]|nr:nuclear transport factor 2 family protein [Solirubrobacterales bacterium]